MQISYACMTHLFHLISQSTSMQLEVLNYHGDRHHLKASKSLHAYISPKSMVNEMPFLQEKYIPSQYLIIVPSGIIRATVSLLCAWQAYFVIFSLDR